MFNPQRRKSRGRGGGSVSSSEKVSVALCLCSENSKTQDDAILCKGRCHPIHRTMSSNDDVILYTRRCHPIHRATSSNTQDDAIQYTGRCHPIHRAMSSNTQDDVIQCTGRYHPIHRTNVTDPCCVALVPPTHRTMPPTTQDDVSKFRRCRDPCTSRELRTGQGHQIHRTMPSNTQDNVTDPCSCGCSASDSQDDATHHAERRQQVPTVPGPLQGQGANDSNVDTGSPFLPLTDQPGGLFLSRCKAAGCTTATCRNPSLSGRGSRKMDQARPRHLSLVVSNVLQAS